MFIFGLFKNCLLTFFKKLIIMSFIDQLKTEKDVSALFFFVCPTANIARGGERRNIKAPKTKINVGHNN